MIDTGSFTSSLPTLTAGGYIALFAVILIEGPAITAIGAFAARLGYFDGRIVFLLSILGNLIPDIVYYYMGYFGRQSFVERHPRIFGPIHGHIKRIEQLLRDHPGKTLTVVKMVPIFATPGLVLAGIVRMPLKKYAWWSVAIIIPSSLFFYLVGYYFGAFYAQIARVANYGGYVLGALVVLFFAVAWAYRRIAARLAQKIERI